jgi:beta-glucanase (GH16 family)
MKTKKQKLLVTVFMLFFMSIGYSQNWQIVWQDEFNNGISPDWSFETGTGSNGWGNHELQYYRQENATVENGNLVIRAKRESFGGANYTSARMKTQGKKSWKYGKMEARISMPAFQGIWPAFWMLGDNIGSVGWPKCGEIDIMEHINTGGDVFATIHWDNNGHQSYSKSANTSVTNFHTYTIEWDQNSIKWFIDGNLFNEANIANNINGTEEFQNNFFILLNLAVGGDYPGSNIDNNGFPGQMLVDYVRVYQKGVNPPLPSNTGLVTAYADCPYAGFSIGLEPGDYNEARLNSLGMSADKISSIKVAEGYEVILYDLDNFAGPSVVSGNSACLDAVGFNDKAASLRVRTKGDAGISGTFFLQNRSSNLYMDVQGGTGATVDGANIQQWNTAGTTNQQFAFTHLGDGTYKITAVHSGKVIDVSAISKNNGANVQQWSYFGSANQQFILVPTNSGYYKLIAKHSGKVVEVAGCSALAEANVQQWDNNNQLCAEWKLVPVTTTNPSFTKLIQAEDYSVMQGIQKETTTDVGGGQNIAYTDATDYMVYNAVNFPTTGTYTIEYRVASAIGTAKISSDLNAGSIQLGALNIPNTGGWQNWTTISQTVTINAGTYNFGIYIQSGGANINWFKITKVGTAKSTISKTEITADESFSVYPNPVENTLNFSTEMVGTPVQIINQIGRLVSEQKVNENNSVDVSKLNTGIYFITANKNGNQIVKRFLKK